MTAGCGRPLQSGVAKWPEMFSTPEADAKKEDVLEGMRVSRPVVETGQGPALMFFAEELDHIVLLHSTQPGPQ